MAKQSKQRTYFTLRAEIVFYAIVEPFMLAFALFLLFFRVQDVYESTPEPIGNNFNSYMVADMNTHWLAYLIIGCILVLWVFGKSIRIIQSRNDGVGCQ